MSRISVALDNNLRVSFSDGCSKSNPLPGSSEISIMARKLHKENCNMSEKSSKTIQTNANIGHLQP